MEKKRLLIAGGGHSDILHSMEKRELIKSYWKEDKRRRKYYEITEKGLREVKKMEKEWTIFSNSMNDLLGGAL